MLEELAGEEEEQTEKPGTIAQGLDGFLEKPKEEDPPSDPPEKIKLYVGNLPYNVDSQKLSLLFEKAGAVEATEVREKKLSFLGVRCTNLGLFFFLLLVHCSLFLLCIRLGFRLKQ